MTSGCLGRAARRPSSAGSTGRPGRGCVRRPCRPGRARSVVGTAFTGTVPCRAAIAAPSVSARLGYGTSNWRSKACAVPASSVRLMPSTLHAVGGVVGGQGREVGGLGAARRAVGVPGVEHDDVAAPVGHVLRGAREVGAGQLERAGAVGRGPGRRAAVAGLVALARRRRRASSTRCRACSRRASEGGERGADEQGTSPHVRPPRPSTRRAAAPRRARCSRCRPGCRRRSAGWSATRPSTAACGGRATGAGARARAA